MVGQDAVFDRPEQGGDAAEAEQREIEQVQRAEIEARGGDHLHADFREFQPARDQGLVVGVGDFAAYRRERNRGQHEDRDGERNLGAGVLCAEAEQDQHRQHLPNEIVVERREKLAPEQRREAPRGHQLAEHARPAPSRDGISPIRRADYAGIRIRNDSRFPRTPGSAGFGIWRPGPTCPATCRIRRPGSSCARWR